MTPLEKIVTGEALINYNIKGSSQFKIGNLATKYDLALRDINLVAA